MNSLPLILTLALLTGMEAHAASATSDKPLSGISMVVAKRDETRPPISGPVTSTALSGAPMVLAKRLGGSTRSGPAPGSDRMLSGVPLVLAKRT